MMSHYEGKMEEAREAKKRARNGITVSFGDTMNSMISQQAIPSVYAISHLVDKTSL